MYINDDITAATDISTVVCTVYKIWLQQSANTEIH